MESFGLADERAKQSYLEPMLDASNGNYDKRAHQGSSSSSLVGSITSTLSKLTRKVSFSRPGDRQLLARLSHAADFPEVIDVTETALLGAADVDQVVGKCMGKLERLLKLGAFRAVGRREMELLWRSAKAMRCPASAVRAIVAALQPAEQSEPALLAETCRVVSELLAEHDWSEDPATFGEICRLVRHLSMRSELRPALLVSGVCAKMMDRDYWVVTCLECPSVAENLSWCVAELAQNEECGKALIDMRLAEYMAEMMAVYSQQPKVVCKLCDAAATLAVNPYLRSHLGSAGLCTAVATVLRKKPAALPVGVVQSAANCIAQLSKNHLDNQSRFGAAGSCQQLVDILQHFGKQPLVEQQSVPAVCAVLTAIHSLSDDIINTSRLRSAQVCVAILSVMGKNKPSAQLNLAACVCLEKLAQQHVVQSFHTNDELVATLQALSSSQMSTEIATAAQRALAAARA